MKVASVLAATLLLTASGCYQGPAAPPEGLAPITHVELPLEESQIPRVFSVSRDFAEEAEMSFDGGRGSFGFVIRLRKGSLDVVAGNGADPNVLALSAYTRDPQEVAGNRELADRYVETIRRAIGGQGRRQN